MTVGADVTQARSHRTGPAGGGGWSLAAFGHLVAIAVNLVLLYVVRNLGRWDVVPFLTADYDQVVDPITVSIVATIIGRAVRIVVPGRRVGLVVDAATTIVGFYALFRIFMVFPFDFSPYDVRWDLLARFVLIVALFGSVVSVLLTPFRVVQNGGPG